MDVTPLIRKDLKIIQSYKGEKIKISGNFYDRPLLVCGVDIFEYSESTLKLEALDILKGRAQILLVGLRAENPMPLDAKTRESFKEAGFSVDMMDSGAAARTYNVLAAEGRDVAVLLF